MAPSAACHLQNIAFVAFKFKLFAEGDRQYFDGNEVNPVILKTHAWGLGSDGVGGGGASAHPLYQKLCCRDTHLEYSTRLTAPHDNKCQVQWPAPPVDNRLVDRGRTPAR